MPATILLVRHAEKPLGDGPPHGVTIDGVVLVSWEHRLIPAMAERIVGGPLDVPTVWPSDRYDLVWVFEPGRDGSRHLFRQVPQMLLAGDRPEPIGASPEVGDAVAP